MASLCAPKRLLRSHPLTGRKRDQSATGNSHGGIPSLPTHRLCSVLLGCDGAKVPVKYGFFRTAFGEPIGDAGNDLDPRRIIFRSWFITSSAIVAVVAIFPCCGAARSAGRSVSLCASSKCATVNPRVKGRFKLTI